MFNRSWWIFLSQILLFTFQTYVNLCIKITHSTKMSVYRCYDEKETLPFISSITLLMISSSCMKRYSEQLFCLDTHNLRSLSPRFPPHNFFFRVERLSLLENRNCCKLWIIFATFLYIFPSLFFSPWDGGTDHRRDKGTQATQKTGDEDVPWIYSVL